MIAIPTKYSMQNKKMFESRLKESVPIYNPVTSKKKISGHNVVTKAIFLNLKKKIHRKKKLKNIRNKRPKNVV